MEMKVITRNNRSVLVTGAAGFVGRALVERLLAEGYQVVALVRGTKVPAHLRQPGVRLANGDLRDEAVVAAALQGVDYVIHAAATMAGSWDDFHAINVMATRQLLALAAQQQVRRFIHLSSASVYRHAGMSAAPVFTEDMPFESEANTTFYAKSKIAAEQEVWQAVRDGRLPCVIFRPGAIFGPGGHIFPATLGLGMGEERIILIGSSRSLLPLSYVENVAEVVVRALQLEGVVGECFNLTEDETLTRREYVQLLRREVNPALKVIAVPLWFMGLMKFGLKQAFGLLGRKAPLSALNLRLYCSSVQYSNVKAKRVFGPTPAVGLQEALARTAKWQRERRTPKRAHGLAAGKVIIPSDRKLRVGLIGCGNIAAVHLELLRGMPNVGAIALADPKPEALQALAGRFGISSRHLDYREMLEKERPEVVHVLTPPQYHAAVTREAAAHGCHVLVEKPMAVDAAEAGDMLRAAQENRVKLGVVHNHLYDEVMITAREILARGLLGRLAFVESWYGAQVGAAASAFAPQRHWGRDLPGTFYHDYLPHPLYLLTEFLPGCRVQEAATSSTGANPDLATDELKVMFQNEQCLGLLSLSLSVAPRYQFVHVYGTKGSMRLDFLNKVVLLDREIGGVPKMLNRSLSAWQHGGRLRRAARRNVFQMFQSQKYLFAGTQRLMGLFYRSILLNEPEPVPAAEGVETMRLMDQIWAGLQTPDLEVAAKRRA